MTLPSRTARGRFYVKDSVVPVEEDRHHEFKGHRCLTVEDLGPYCFRDENKTKRSRRAASRAINSFLNSGEGGIVYLGISDDGSVIGLPLTQFQKDHILVSLQDLLEKRYKPAVLPDQYQVDFIPALPAGVQSFDEMFDKSHPALGLVCSPEMRQRPHLLRSHFPCWCSRDRTALFRNGYFCPEYVIEISVMPFHCSVESLFPLQEQIADSDNDDDEDSLDTILKLQLPNLYEDEEGRCYYRLQASSLPYTLEEIRKMVIAKAYSYYQPIVERLQKQRLQLMQEQSNQDLQGT